MKGISIIICCYNSAVRLPQTICHIARQNVKKIIPWEVLIINNGSSDDTVIVAQSEWQKYSCNIPFKIIDQPLPGLSNARQKGVNESSYDYILFCDDDNWLDSEYINIAFQTMEDKPDVGIAGGQSIAHFETEEPFWFKSFSQSYVVEKPYSASGYIPSEREYLAGAGMVLRKDIFITMQSVGFKPILIDRIGNTLMSGGDYELCLVAKYLGYGIFFEEKLTLVHYMPKERLTWDYCINMTTVGHAIPEIVFDLYRKVHHACETHKNLVFESLYLRLMMKYIYNLLFPEDKGIKGLWIFLTNLHLFFRMHPGSILQRKQLSSKNKLMYLVKNKKSIKRNFVSIQTLFERIK